MRARLVWRFEPEAIWPILTWHMAHRLPAVMEERAARGGPPRKPMIAHWLALNQGCHRPPLILLQTSCAAVLLAFPVCLGSPHQEHRPSCHQPRAQFRCGPGGPGDLRRGGPAGSGCRRPEARWPSSVGLGGSKHSRVDPFSSQGSVADRDLACQLAASVCAAHAPVAITALGKRLHYICTA